MGLRPTMSRCQAVVLSGCGVVRLSSRHREKVELTAWWCCPTLSCCPAVHSTPRKRGRRQRGSAPYCHTVHTSTSSSCSRFLSSLLVKPQKTRGCGLVPQMFCATSVWLWYLPLMIVGWCSKLRGEAGCGGRRRRRVGGGRCGRVGVLKEVH